MSIAHYRYRMLTGWIVFALTASHPAVTLVMLFVQGALSFAVGSTLISQVLYAADGAPTLGGSFATAAFNVGAALGPALGGLAIGMGLSYRAPLWTSAALVTLAIVIGVATLSLWRRPASVHETVPA